MHGVSAGHWGTETFNGREDLLVEVPFDVRLESRGGRCHLCRSVGTFGGGFMGRGGARGRRGHDVGDHIVDADAFALGEGAESDLDLGHAVGIGVVFGIFT